MNILYKCQNSILFLLKATLYVVITATFFVVFGLKYEWVLGLSRTSGVSLVTFCVVLTATISVYGGYLIGRQKSKPIIISMSLATLITDVVTYLQFCIMSVNPHNNDHFVFESPHLLILVMIIQIAAIVLFAYLGNFVYFTINPPENCCIITSSEESLNAIAEKINRYRKQYKICDMIHYTSNSVFDVINKNDTIFLYDIPQKEKVILNEYCYASKKNIYYSFEMNDIVALGAKTAILDDKPVVSAVVRDLTVEQRFVKRLMDIVISLIAVIIFGIPMLVCALLIKIEGWGWV